jgi:hypothetical protein
MTDLFDEIEEELDDTDASDEGEGGTTKKERIVKPAIVIHLDDKLRIVLMSDRRNIQIQTKSEKVETHDITDTMNQDELSGWKTRGYYGTRDWKSIIEKAYGLAKEERLGRKVVNETEDLKEAIHNTTAEIKKWAKQIVETLVINKIIL